MSATALLDYLDRRARDLHRGTVRYSSYDKEILHLRDDIREDRGDSEIDEMLTRLRPEATKGEEVAFPFGELKATVRRFDNAIILHFPLKEDNGIVVSLEPEAARDLTTFIGECEKRIHG